MVIKELELSKNEFALRLGYKNNGVIYDYSKEDGTETKPGYEFFDRLVHADTGIRIEYLITGKGERFHKKPTPATKNNEAAIMQANFDKAMNEVSALTKRAVIDGETIKFLTELLGREVIEQRKKNSTLTQSTVPAK